MKEEKKKTKKKKTKTPNGQKALGI